MIPGRSARCNRAVHPVRARRRTCPGRDNTPQGGSNDPDSFPPTCRDGCRPSPRSRELYRATYLRASASDGSNRRYSPVVRDLGRRSCSNYGLTTDTRDLGTRMMRRSSRFSSGRMETQLLHSSFRPARELPKPGAVELRCRHRCSNKGSNPFGKRGPKSFTCIGRSARHGSGSRPRSAPSCAATR